MTMARRRVPSSGFRPTQESAPVGQYDWGLIALFLMLLCIGLLMVLSASGVVAERINGDKYFFFKRQLIYAVIGGVVMWVLAAVPRHILYKFQYPFLLFVLMLLFVTLSPLGARVNGAQRWISVKFFSIQPLEFAKIALALYLAYFMSTKQELVKTFSKGIIPPFAMTALFCFLLLAQPDFGGAVVLSLILFFMCLIGGTRFIYLFMAIGVGLAGALALIRSRMPRMRGISLCSPCMRSVPAASSAWAWAAVRRRCSICPKRTTTLSWRWWARSSAFSA